MQWRIYYEDGSTFSDEDGTPWDAPREGVEVIQHPEGKEGKWSLMGHSDYYVWEPERCDWGWNWCNLYDLRRYLVRCKHPLVLHGAMIRSSQFTEIEKRALAELPGPKLAWRRDMDKQSSGLTSAEGVMQ